MAERPILFSAPMVRALLAGTKTQTRRAVKWRGLAPGLNLQFSGLTVDRSGSNYVLSSPTRDSYAYRSVPQPCPYGQPGDKLWVRETWTHDAASVEDLRAKVEDAMPDHSYGPYFRADMDDLEAGSFPRWRPSIHIPRWASRIDLEVTGVRVERLQDISEEDSVAEGGERRDEFPHCPWWHGRYGKVGSCMYVTARDSYRYLWDSINGAGSWDANPWVWAVEFRRIQSHGQDRVTDSGASSEAAQPVVSIGEDHPETEIPPLYLCYGLNEGKLK